MSETLEQAPITATLAGSLARKRMQLLALAAMSSVYFLSYFHRVSVPGTIFNQLQADLSLPASAVTAFAAILLGSYAAVQLFVGLAADRFGGVRVIVTGGLIMSAGAVLFPLCHSTTALYLCRALTGFGAGFMYLSILREVAVMFGPRRFAMLTGIVGCVGYCGGMSATWPLERATAEFGWRASLIVGGVLTLASVLVAGGLLRRMGLPRVRGNSLSLRPIVMILKNRRCWPMLVVSVINFPIYFVIQTTIGKKFLEDFGGLSSSAAASITLLMLATAGATTMAGGFLPALFGHRRRPVLLIATLLTLASVVILLCGVELGAPGWVLLTGYVVLAASSCVSPSTAAVMKELNPPDTVALAIAMPNTLSYAGVAILAYVAGLILDAFRAQAIVKADHIVYPPKAYAVLFVVLLVLGLVSLVATCMVPETGTSADLSAPRRSLP